MKKYLSYGRSLSKDRPYAKKNSAFSDTPTFILSKLCAKLSALIDHHEYQTVNKIALRNLDTNNPFYEKYFRESMKSFSQINYRKPAFSLFDFL